MARYVATIESRLSPAEALAYVTDLTHAVAWDPSVQSVEQLDGTPVGVGARFDLVARVAGRNVPLRYTLVEHDPGSRAVLEARGHGYVTRDSITVEPASEGSRVHYDSVVTLVGRRRILDPLLQFALSRSGDRAVAGLRSALNL